MRIKRLLLLGAVAVVGILGWWGARAAFMRVEVEVPRGDRVPDAPFDLAAEGATAEQAVAALEGVGLSPQGRLGEIGVAGHIARMEAEGTDTGLDAALDLMAVAQRYVASVPKEFLAQHAKEIEDATDATLFGWQNLVAGTTRTNPLTKKPVFSHGFLARFNVVTMYEHRVGTRLGVSKAWGWAGFAPAYVGTPKNANQVEHMSISLILQALFEQPLAVLNAIERAKLAAGGADEAEAHADMALNRAIHEVFVPTFREDLLGAVEALRIRLKE